MCHRRRVSDQFLRLRVHTLLHLSSMLLSLLCEVSGSSFCHMSNEDLESSLWSNFMRRSVFLPTSRSDALRSALTQVDELKQLINHFKERYVSRVFRETNYEAHAATYSELHFPWLLSPIDPIVTNSSSLALPSTQAFQSAYQAFQRVAIGLELVVRDLRTKRDFANKYGRWWQLAQRTANRVVEATYVTLLAHGISTLTPDETLLKRSIVPHRLRCVRHTSRRDVRDWVILSDSVRIAHHFSIAFNSSYVPA